MRPAWLTAALLLAATLLAACDGGPPTPSSLESQATDQPEFVAAAKGRIDIEGGLVKLAAKRDGVVQEVLVEEGAEVESGQVLLVLDDQQARLSTALVEAELVEARSALAPLQVKLEADDSQRFPATVLRLGLVVGQRTASDDPNERQDNRVVECVLVIDAPDLLIGQRVIVRFLAGD